jgi:hypothetical protein
MGAPGLAGAKVSLLVAQGNLKEAESALKSAGIPAEAPVTYRTDVIHLAWLRWMIASRHLDAFSLAERIVHSAESEQRNGTLIYALVVGRPRRRWPGMAGARPSTWRAGRLSACFHR